MSPYSLNCSVCQGEYFSRDNWLRHLSTIKHQIPAREECLQEWNKPNGLKECCLVVFSSFPLTPSSADGDGNGGAEKLLRYFSTKDPKIFVTDFVWWGDRARYGILQFESKNKALEMLSMLDGSKEVLVDNNARVQVKWAGEVLELEWNAVLPTDDVNIPARAVTTNNETSTMEPMSCDDSCRIVSGSVLLAPDESNVSDNRTMPSNNGVGYQIPVMSSPMKRAISDLEKLAIQRNWNPPVFRSPYFTSDDGCLSKYIGSVVLNGMVYTGAGKTKDIAKQQAALNCLRKLPPPLVPSPTQDYVEQSGNVSDSAQEVKCHNSKLGVVEPKKRAVELDEDNQLEELNRQLAKKMKIGKIVMRARSPSKNPVSLLYQLATRNDLPPPIFKFREEGIHTKYSRIRLIRYTSCVVLNGVEYKPKGEHARTAKNKRTAKQQAAMFCLKTLTATQDCATQPVNVRSDSCQERYRGSGEENGTRKQSLDADESHQNHHCDEDSQFSKMSKTEPSVPTTEIRGAKTTKARSTLRDLAQRNQWKPPRYKLLNTEMFKGKPLYSFSVNVNGVDYYPDPSIPKADTKAMAKRSMAELCLKKLKEPLTKPMSSNSGWLMTLRNGKIIDKSRKIRTSGIEWNCWN